MKGIADVIPHLLKAGADVNIKTDHHGSPLKLLCNFLSSEHLQLKENANLLFLFAEHGARYDLDKNTPKHIQLQRLSDSWQFESKHEPSAPKYVKLYHLGECLHVDFKHISSVCFKILCLLFAIGEKSKIDPNEIEKVHYSYCCVQTAFEEVLLKDLGGFYCELVVKSGYKPGKLDEIVDGNPNLAEKVQLFRETYDKPLTLKRQAANVIRTSLKPNAVAGLKHLHLPPGFDSSYITLGLSLKTANLALL